MAKGLDGLGPASSQAWPPPPEQPARCQSVAAQPTLSALWSASSPQRVLGQVVLAQALLPLLREDPGSSYTVITGRLGK